jgi:hypothetical protein
VHYDYSYIPVPVAIACVPFLKNYPFLPLPLACSFRCRCLYYIPSDYQFQLAFVPAHTPKPILRNLLFWLSKVASSIHSTRGSVRPGSLRLTTLAPFKWIKKSSLAFGKRVGVKAVFAVAVRAEQAVVSVTGQGLVTSRHTRLLFPRAGTSLT